MGILDFRMLLSIGQVILYIFPLKNGPANPIHHLLDHFIQNVILDSLDLKTKIKEDLVFIGGKI